jgi:cytidylate kinase
MSQHIFLGDEDVSDFIRTPEISMYASKASALPAVRKFLLDMQRNFSKDNNVIMDGRDIGTVVLPNADVKIFLTASSEERAKRRYDELIAKGQDVKYEDVLSDMIKRDKNDSERQTAPCVPADDAIILDDSGFELEQTLNRALEIVYEKINEAV